MHILFAYLKKYWKLIILALVLATINQVFSLLAPLIFQHIVDDYASKVAILSVTKFLHGVGLLLLASMGVALVSRTAKNFQDYYVNVITQKLGAKMYTDGLRHSLRLPYAVFEDQRSGETLGKLQNMRNDVQLLITPFVNVIFTALIGFLFIAIYALTLNWIIALMFFLTVPIITTVSIVLSQKIKKVQTVILAKTNSLAGSTTESLRNIELVKSLGLANQEIKRLNDTTQAILNLELQKVKYVRSLSFIQGTIVNAMSTLILFTSLFLLFFHKITFGEFFSLYFYSFFVFNPLQDIGNIINTYRQTEASLKNFSDIMAMEPEKLPAHPVNIGGVRRLEFKDVTFKHQSASTNAVNDVSFSAEFGHTIAFVGPSGAGKTTLVKLLVGLYQPEKGSVEYNNHSSREINLDALREQIGLVTQDTQLFSGTIRDNLLFVRPDATDPELFDVLNKAAAQTLMARADKGLDTVIGEGGVKVSGGEKQRLSIARALLRRPNILVFDEATSALDSLTEEGISKTIRELAAAKQQITVMIAHRLSTIMHADTIFVLEKGEVIEQGSHEELLKKKGLYQAMWRQQIGER